MTEEEKKELENIFNISIYSTEYLPHETYTDLFKRKLIEFIEQKKKEWQEQAYEKGKEDADFLNNQFNRP
jgi:non-homologous end joining protein Ku